MKKFRTWYDTKIEEVEVVRETAKFVVVKEHQYERKCAKRGRSDDQNYFDTWQDAKAFLIDREKDAIKGHQNDIERHQETLKKIEAMRA